MAIAPKTGVSAILIKPIRDIEGNVVGLGELVQGDVAIVPGPLEFQDGTQQNTAYVPEDNVTGFAGRKGAITPQTGDYTGSQVVLSPLVGGASNVQDAFAVIGNQVSSIQGATKYAGTLGFNDADPAKPAAGTSITPYYIFNTAGKRTVGDAAGKDVEIGDWLAFNSTANKWELLPYSARAALAKSTAYDSQGNKVLKGTEVQTALDQADAALDTLNTKVAAAEAADYVNTFNGRKGDVVPADFDYNAVQIKAFSVGPITKSTQVQGALNELERAIVELQQTAGSSSALDAHINATADAHDASAISYAPVEGVAATNVQDAIQEVAMKALPFFDTNGASKPIKFI